MRAERIRNWINSTVSGAAVFGMLGVPGMAEATQQRRFDINSVNTPAPIYQKVEYGPKTPPIFVDAAKTKKTPAQQEPNVSEPEEFFKTDPTPLRIKLIAEKTNIPVEVLNGYTDAQIADIFKDPKSNLGAMLVEENPKWDVPTITTQEEGIIADAKEKIDQTFAPYQVTKGGLPVASNYLYLPKVTSAEVNKPWEPPQLPFTRAELSGLIAKVQTAENNLIPKQLPVEGESGCPGEGIGTPGYIQLPDGTLNIIGESAEAGEFINSIVGPDYYLSSYKYKFPNGKYATVWMDKLDQKDGSTSYSLSIRESNLAPGAAFGFGEFTIASDISKLNLPYSVLGTLAKGKFFPTARFALRHACPILVDYAPEQPLNSSEVNYYQSYNAGLIAKEGGYQQSSDVWGPMFGRVYSDPNFPFTTAAAPECFEDLGPLKKKNKAGVPRIPYESKVCKLGVDAFLDAAALDPHYPTLYAINALLQKGNPDAVIEAPGILPGDTTPRKLFTYVIDKFSVKDENKNVIGINKLGSDPEIASQIRGAAAVRLAADLCYKYHDPLACAVLPSLLNGIQGAIVGDDGKFETEELGTIQRNDSVGAVLPGWRKVSPASGVVSAAQDKVVLELARKSMLQELIDSTGMTPESLDVSRITGESQIGTIKALEAVQQYVDPLSATNVCDVPSTYRVIQLDKSSSLIAVPTHNSDTLDSLRIATGASKVCEMEKGIENCRNGQGIGENKPLSPNKGYRIYDATYDFVMAGDRVAHNEQSACNLGPSGPSDCAFPSRPYPFGLCSVKASTLVDMGTRNNGCENVTVSKSLDDGTTITFPGEDFIISPNTEAYRLTSTKDCTLTIGTTP